MGYFFPDEIQLLISGGINEINMHDLQQNCKYNGWEQQDAPYLQQLWAILTSYSQQEKEKFL